MVVLATLSQVPLNSQAPPDGLSVTHTIRPRSSVFVIVFVFVTATFTNTNTVPVAADPGQVRRVMRQQVWMRGLRTKSGGMVWAEMSSIVNSESPGRSSRNRWKLLENSSTPS